MISEFEARAGQTIYLEDSSGVRHLNVILTSPNSDGKVVIVNFTEQRPGVDQTVVFSPRVSLLFSKNTVVSYPDARLILASELMHQAERAGKDCDEDIFNEIVEGAFRSAGTRGYILQELSRDYPEIYSIFINS